MAHTNKDGNRVNRRAGEPGFHEVPKPIASRHMPVAFGLTADQLEQGAHVPMLPTVEGAVTGIVSFDPPAVQCSGCGLVVGKGHIVRTVQSSGIVFNPRSANLSRRLCKTCRLEAGQSDPTWFKGECPGCGSSYCTGSCGDRVNAARLHQMRERKRADFFTTAPEGTYMVVDVSTGSVMRPDEVVIVNGLDETNAAWEEFLDTIEPGLDDGNIEYTRLRDAADLPNLGYTVPTVYDRASGALMDINPDHVFAVDLDAITDAAEIYGDEAAARKHCRERGFRLWPL